GTPAARWSVLMEQTYRRTVAGALVAAISSMSSTKVAGVAGREGSPFSRHQALQTALSLRNAFSVDAANAPRAWYACFCRFASAPASVTATVTSAVSLPVGFFIRTRESIQNPGGLRRWD